MRHVPSDANIFDAGRLRDRHDDYAKREAEDARTRATESREEFLEAILKAERALLRYPMAWIARELPGCPLAPLSSRQLLTARDYDESVTAGRVFAKSRAVWLIAYRRTSARLDTRVRSGPVLENDLTMAPDPSLPAPSDCISKQPAPLWTLRRGARIVQARIYSHPLGVELCITDTKSEEFARTQVHKTVADAEQDACATYQRLHDEAGFERA